MKVEIHDLKHQKWHVEAEPSDTIAEIKERNYENHGIDRNLTQKMIYSGKILKDADTLESIKYSEGKGFIVCMATKARKPVAKPAAEASESPAPSSESATAPDSAQPRAESADSASTPQNAPLIPSSETGFPSGPSALATGWQLASVLANIMDMGYSRQQVLLAMNRAYNNPDRAVEYLVTGQIPEDSELLEGNESEGERSGTERSGNERSGNDSAAVSAAGTPPGTSTNTTNSRASSAAPQTDANASTVTDNNSIDRDLFDAADRQMQMEEEVDVDEVEEEIDFQQLLGLDDQQLEELRTAVRQNPTHLLEILDPIVRQNSAVAETLINNLDQFLWYMTSPEERDAIASGDVLEPGSESGRDGSEVISLTEDEAAAVNRLMELGFEWEDAVTAYLACDKDEQLTANYLFEHGHEDI